MINKKILSLIVIVVLLCSSCSKPTIQKSTNSLSTIGSKVSSQINSATSQSSSSSIPTQNQSSSSSTPTQNQSSSNSGINTSSNSYPAQNQSSSASSSSSTTVQKDDIATIPTEQNFTQISTNKADPILRLYILYLVQFYTDKLGDAQSNLQTAQNEKNVKILDSNGNWIWVADPQAVANAQNDVNTYQKQFNIWIQTSADYNIDIHAAWVLTKNVVYIEPYIANQIKGHVSDYQDEVTKSQQNLTNTQNQKLVNILIDGQWVLSADPVKVRQAEIQLRDNQRELKYWTSFADIGGLSY